MLPGAGPSDRFAARRYSVPPVTLTFTYAFDQQHWNPPPPSPVESFTCTRSVYSPAVPNVALVVFFPPLSLSIGGPAGSNFTVAPAGWRYTAHFTAIGGGGVNPSGSPSAARSPRGPRPPVAPVAPLAPAAPASAVPRPRPRPRPRPVVSGMLIFGPSSVTHVMSASGVLTAIVYEATVSVGGPVNAGPPGWNMIFGGVFLLAASSNGSTT